AYFFPIQPSLGIAVVGSCSQGVFQRRSIRMGFGIRLHRDLLFQCLTFAEMIQTDVGSDSVNPGVKARLEAKTSKRSISLEEGLLENFPRLLAVSQHVKRETQNVSIMPSDQLLESLTVAALS